jgi:hypothetical protein
MNALDEQRAGPRGLVFGTLAGLLSWAALGGLAFALHSVV